MRGIWTYDQFLPGIDEQNRLTLGEGKTPLVKSRRLASLLGLRNLYFKLEIANPTGSYKDRFAAAAVSALKQKKSKFCLATSSGNTGSALAAHCAAAGIKCFLILVDGTPEGKMQQMNIYGAETIVIKNFGKDFTVTKQVMEGLQRIGKENNSDIQISAYCYNAFGMSGVQTIAYEIAEELPNVNHIFSPAGGGGLTLSIVRGCNDWQGRDDNFRLPKINCVQPEGNDTIASALRNDKSTATAIKKTQTRISGLQVPNVLDGDMVIEECRRTGGTGYIVSDDEVYESQKQLAQLEGIYCEPAGAVALTGLKKAVENKEINSSDNIVCLVTGHGFKDPSSASNIALPKERRKFETFDEMQRYINNEI